MSSENVHEPYSDLSADVLNIHRAITSLIEELEAIDWYNQRADICEDKELKAILIHNRDEEKEHAAMLIEWLRRKDKSFENELKDYLMTSKSIAGIEENS